MIFRSGTTASLAWGSFTRLVVRRARPGRCDRSFPASNRIQSVPPARINPNSRVAFGPAPAQPAKWAEQGLAERGILAQRRNGAENTPALGNSRSAIFNSQFSISGPPWKFDQRPTVRPPSSAPGPVGGRETAPGRPFETADVGVQRLDRPAAAAGSREWIGVTPASFSPRRRRATVALSYVLT